VPRRERGSLLSITTRVACGIGTGEAATAHR